MCYKVHIPTEEKLTKALAPLGFEVASYEHFYHADGFTRPLLPITSGDTPRSVNLGRWKLLPSSVKNEAEAKKAANTLNARCETIFELFSYKRYIGKNRCLLWVDGFFEPNHPDPDTTLPYYVTMEDGQPFTLGGVYNDWTDKDTGIGYRTFSVITTDPNDLMRKVHNEGERMPLIIKPEDRDKWIGPLDEASIIEMMVTLPDGFLKAYPVSSDLYARGFNANISEIILPLSEYGPSRAPVKEKAPAKSKKKAEIKPPEDSQSSLF